MKKALIIVDMQKAYFANEELELRRTQLTKVCNQLIADAHRHEAPVILLRTEHTRTRETWTLNMIDDDQGYLFAGDEDAKFVDGLETSGCTEVIKTRDSGFWQTDLLRLLKREDIERVVICGVSTHTCVAQTAADAYSANLRVELAADAIATHAPDYHETTLALLVSEYRMTRVTTKNIAWM